MFYIILQTIPIKVSGGYIVTYGGHALMSQYPERLSAIVNTFLDNRFE